MNDLILKDVKEYFVERIQKTNGLYGYSTIHGDDWLQTILVFCDIVDIDRFQITEQLKLAIKEVIVNRPGLMNTPCFVRNLAREYNVIIPVNPSTVREGAKE